MTNNTVVRDVEVDESQESESQESDNSLPEAILTNEEWVRIIEDSIF